MNDEVRNYLSKIGKKGGSSRTLKKALSSAKNGKNGGRPSKMEKSYLYTTVIDNPAQDSLLYSLPNKVLLGMFTKGLFWSFDKEKLDFIKNKDLIIEHILETEIEKDEITLWKLYDYFDIKRVALNSCNLNSEIVSYLSFVFNSRKEDFKCCTKKPWYRKS